MIAFCHVFGDCFLYIFRSALKHDRHGIIIAAKCRSFCIDFCGFSEIDHPIEVHDVGARLFHQLQDRRGIAADVEAGGGSQILHGFENPLFVWQGVFGILCRRYLRGDRVTQADDVRTGFDLGFGEFDFHLHTEFQQFLHPFWPFEQIHHQVVDSPDVRGFGHGALNPAHNRNLSTHFFPEQPDRFEPVRHAAAIFRFNPLQLAQIFRILNEWYF